MRRRLILACLLLMGAAQSRGADTPSLSVAFQTGPGDKVVRIAVVGLDQGALAAAGKRKADARAWDAAARVQVIVASGSDDRQVPAVLGSWQVEKDKLLFEPRFSFAADTAYRVTIDAERLADPAARKTKPSTFELRTPKKDLAPVTRIEHIYPSRAVLPENQLRFYIHFSRPMTRGEAYEHIQLLDAAGKPIKDVFLELGEELWDPSMKRFTLLFHPGRVKTGLRPREEMGPILEDGKSYSLVVNGGWHDADGKPLIDKEYRKRFKAGPPDDEPIDPRKWKLATPAAATTTAFQIRFPRPLDHALLHRVVWIVDDQGRRVEGKIDVSEEETVWSFTPARPWPAGKFRLVAETILEDLAANRIGRKFEVDMLRPVDKPDAREIVELPFDVKSK